MIRGGILLASLLASGLLHASSGFRFTEKLGSFAVGFKVVEQYDGSRTFLGRTDPVTGQPITTNRARPIQTLIWYPAEKAGSPLRYGDYLALTGSEDRYDRSAEQIAATAEFRLRDYLPPDFSAAALGTIKNEPMWAIRDASARSGKFPVVIYAPSHNASAAENADLCEYLASYGYVVLASPSFGVHSRWMASDLADIEVQAGDIEFLIGYASTLLNADNSHVAVIGYSWGGIANVFAAAKDNRITALVGFDGGIRLVGKMVAASKYVVPERLTVPYLYLSSAPGALEDLYRQQQDLSDDLLARLKFCDLYLVTMEPLLHYHFSSEHLRFLSAHNLESEYPLDEIYQAYGGLARYTRTFLDGTLKNDANALASVAGKPEGFPRHAVRVEVTHSQGLPLTREVLAAEMFRAGFAHADEVYDRLSAQNPGTKLAPPEFLDWIEDLANLHRLDDAIAIAKLFIKTYPERPGPYHRLAELQLEHGDKTSAIENYKKALAIDPSNEAVASKLAALGGKPARVDKK